MLFLRYARHLFSVLVIAGCSSNAATINPPTHPLEAKTKEPLVTDLRVGSEK